MSNTLAHVEIEYHQKLFNASIQHLFESHVEQTPTAIAALCDSAQLTYHELNRRANRVAYRLQKLGVGAETLVGIYVERSLDMLVALLATVKAGGAFVPLDPSHPQERLTFLLDDSKITVLLTQERLFEHLPELNAQVVCVDRKDAVEFPDSNPPCEISEENAAYVIYTSGSTGQPKGVIITHGAIAQHSLAIQKHFHLTAQDRVLQFSTFTFDTAIEQIFSTLITGATLVLRGPEVWTSTEIYQKLLDFRVSVMNLPTAYWQQMVYDWANESNTIVSTWLRLVIIGGDRLLPHYLHLWQRLPMHEVRLINAYGPTETTISATMFDIPMYEESIERVPIGHALGARTLHILDEQGNPVARGDSGELHIGGPLLARGYLHRPELTAQRFVRDPFNQDEQARLYKTGDLVRELPDGTLDFIGRIDYQVKVRGFRIEPGEIEAVLKRYPGIRETVVVAHEQTTGHKTLAAYFIPEYQHVPDIQQIRTFLKEKLPEYMVPTALVQLDAFPLNPNGKIDRHALPTPTHERTPDHFVAPSSPLQLQLIALWEDLLTISPIGISDDFFELGGDSLLALRLFSRVEQVFSKKLPLATFYTAATIEHLAQVMEQQETEAPFTRTPLETIQGNGSRQPFFYLHGDWTNTAFYCSRMVSELGQDQPFYVLEPYKFDGLRIPPSFQEMVQTHLDTMRSIQPEGPYLLAGFCNGALVAYAMAHMLQERGEKVELLVLIDFSYTTARAMLTHRALRRVGTLLGMHEEQQINLFLRLRHLYKHFQPSPQQKLQDFEHLHRVDQRFHRLLPPVEVLRLDYVGMFTWVAANYQPCGYCGKITFLWDSEDTSAQEAELPFVSEVESEKYSIRGNHITCRTEHYRELGQRLRMCLDKVERIKNKQ